MWTTIADILLAVLSVAALASVWATRRTLTSYFSGYGQEKGKNLATHEDIDKLVEQVQAVTTATKVIEAKISNDVWERQRRWEVRRDAVFETLKELASADQSLRLVLVSCDVFGAKPDRDDHIKAQSAYIEKYHQARVMFARAKMLAMVACSKEVRNQFDLVGESLDVGAKRALAGYGPKAWDKLHGLWKQISVLVAMVRKDLGIDGEADATPQSSESLATPNPAGQ